MKILVVDDDDMMQESLRDLLAGEGYTVMTASHGGQALEILQKHPADIMITDIIMPFKEGVETIIECKRQWKDLKIIAMSGGGRAALGDFLEMAQKCGADKVVQKPFNPVQLIAEIESLFAAGS